MNFILLPLPKAPTYGILRVKTPKTALTLLHAVLLPLTKIVHPPSFMRLAVPLIGQSSTVTRSRFKRCIARFLSTIGSVLVSITIKRDCDLRLFAQPGAIFSKTSSSAATDGSDVINTSAQVATAAQDERPRPPTLCKCLRGCA